MPSQACILKLTCPSRTQFSVNMGTGIVSILLHTLGTTYSSQPLRYISIAVFICNLALFFAILAATILRYVMYPAVWNLMIKHPFQSLFLGTAPMGLATLVNFFALEFAPRWGNWARVLVWSIWWVDVVASIATAVGLPFMM